MVVEDGYCLLDPAEITVDNRRSGIRGRSRYCCGNFEKGGTWRGIETIVTEILINYRNSNSIEFFLRTSIGFSRKGAVKLYDNTLIPPSPRGRGMHPALELETRIMNRNCNPSVLPPPPADYFGLIRASNRRVNLRQSEPGIPV